MKKKFIASIFILSLLITWVAGCSNNKNESKSNKNTENKIDQQKKTFIKNNKELTKKVKDEKGVLNGLVYEQNDLVVGTLVLDNKLSDEDAKKLAQKYVDELKSKYKDKKVNVQAVRNGKNVANITKK